MAITPTNLARVSNTLMTRVTTQSLARTQQDLLTVQNQISTGDKISTPSDDPGSAAIIMSLQKTLETRQAYMDNVTKASSQLSQVDSTVGDVTDLLNQAQSLASANVGSEATPDARQGAAEVVKSIYNQLLSLGNTQFNGTYLFGGDRSNAAPFVESLGGVQFAGSNTQLTNAFDDSTAGTITTSASSVFGQIEAKVAGPTANLAPSLTASTRLADLRGALGNGVKPAGAITLSDGATTKTIDLTGAETVGDVITRINAAAAGGITASINPTNTGIQLTGGGTDNISVAETGAAATTAADLGILTPAGAGAGNPVVGGALSPRLSGQTLLSTINGGALDLSSGIKITNGPASATLSFATDVTVDDMLRRINNSNTGVRAQINASGDGIDLYNTIQGTALSIGENGGTTATDLGLRTFNANTTLGSLNDGKGIHLAPTPPGGPALRVTLSDGSNVDVDLAGATTVGDALAAINAAGGGQVTASLAATGNGIVLTDNAGGGGPTAVSSLNGSSAAADLGLDAAPAGNVVTGRDVAPVYATGGAFTLLARLQAALQNNDQAGITAAADGLKAVYDQAVRAHGSVGAQVQDLESRKNRLTDQNVATQSALSNLKDVDMTEAITRFQLLQNALQASLQAAGKTLNLSLMDFIS